MTTVLVIFLSHLRDYLAIIVGYLFARLGLLLFREGFSKDKGSLQWTNSQLGKFVFSGQGPGLFFMAFGAVIVCIACMSPGPSVDLEKSDPNTKTLGNGLRESLHITSNVKAATIKPGGPLRISLGATGQDSRPVKYSAQNLPEGAKFEDRIFSWTPTREQTGDYQVTFTVSDGKYESSQVVTITVQDDPNSPRSPQRDGS
jgi:hypothetical protein